MENALNALAGEHTSILAFDCEFWHVGDTFLPREVGGYHLTKKGSTWSKSKFLAILPAPRNQLNRISSKYSTTTAKTAKLLDSIEKAEHSAPEDFKRDQGLEVYMSDPLVKPHLKPISWLKQFVEKMAHSVVVVKGDTDLKAIKSACLRNKFAYHPPLKVIDIARYNRKFTQRCKTARLEGAYKCISHEVGSTLKKSFPVGRAHNPVTDAAMTLQIAIWLNKKRSKNRTRRRM